MHGDNCLNKLMDSFIKGQANFGLEKQRQETQNDNKDKAEAKDDK